MDKFSQQLWSSIFMFCHFIIFSQNFIFLRFFRCNLVKLKFQNINPQSLSCNSTYSVLMTLCPDRNLQLLLYYSMCSVILSYFSKFQSSKILWYQGDIKWLKKSLSLLLRLESNLWAKPGDIFFLLNGTFWYLASKRFHHYSVIIHLCSLWRWKTVEICKIHWKLRSKQRPVLFC